MKDVVLFIKWWWQRREPTDFWTKVWFAGLFFLGAGIGTGNIYLSLIAVLCFMAGAIKWLCWEPIKTSFATFQKERAGLFEAIKDPK